MSYLDENDELNVKIIGSTL